jgi:hypothetical protein
MSWTNESARGVFGSVVGFHRVDELLPVRLANRAVVEGPVVAGVAARPVGGGLQASERQDDQRLIRTEPLCVEDVEVVVEAGRVAAGEVGEGCWSGPAAFWQVAAGWGCGLARH